MNVKAARTTAGRCTVSIPEFSVSADDPKRAARHAETMNGFYAGLRDGIISFASSGNLRGDLRVRGVDGSFEAQQTGGTGFLIRYVIRGRFFAPGPSGMTSVRRSRVVEARWDDGVLTSFTVV